MLGGVTCHIGLILGKGLPFVYPPSWVPTDYAWHDLDITAQVKDGTQVLEALGLCCLNYGALIGRLAALGGTRLCLSLCGLAWVVQRSWTPMDGEGRTATRRTRSAARAES